jgi:hypothetical protein
MIDDLIGGAVDVAVSASESTSTRGCLTGLLLNLLGLALLLGGIGLLIWGKVSGSWPIMLGGGAAIAAGIAAFVWSFIERNR